jgi:hypothetical protein
VLPEAGQLAETGDRWRPFVLLDADGVEIEPVAAFFAELLACDKSAATIRSYGMDLLRWWRFLWGRGVAWDRADRSDARDFARWMKIANKPAPLHWRHRRDIKTETAPKPVPEQLPPGAPQSAHGEVVTRAEIRADNASALRDRPAGLLRLPPLRGNRADPEPVSTGSLPALWQGTCSPQP